MAADTMRAEGSAARVDAGMKQLRQAARDAAASGHKLVLAYMGAGAYMLDGVVSVYRRGERLIVRAEKRGEVMEYEVKRRFGSLEEQAVSEMRRLQSQAEESILQMRESQGDVNDELEKRIELLLSNMGLPSRDRLERLGQEIDALNQKLDEQILRLPAEPVLDQLG